MPGVSPCTASEEKGPTGALVRASRASRVYTRALPRRSSTAVSMSVTSEEVTSGEGKGCPSSLQRLRQMFASRLAGKCRATGLLS